MVPFALGSLIDQSARIRPGVESNPYRIGLLVGMATWGSRVRDNPRLREVSPTGKCLGGRGGAVSQFRNSRRNHWIDRFRDPMRNLGQCLENPVRCIDEHPENAAAPADLLRPSNGLKCQLEFAFKQPSVCMACALPADMPREQFLTDFDHQGIVRFGQWCQLLLDLGREIQLARDMSGQDVASRLQIGCRHLLK